MIPILGPGKLRKQKLALSLAIGLMLSGLLSSARQMHGQSSATTSAPPTIVEEPNWQAVCSKALSTPLPSPPVAAYDLADSPCDEQALYYGFERPPDYPAALRCAYRRRANPEVGSYREGAGTLAMLYANGYGVPRNYTLAIRFSCELQGAAQAETGLRIGRLEALRDGRLPQGTRFDLCDDQTSGSMGAYCSDTAERLADALRARRIAAVEKQLPDQARAMLPKLEAAEAAFEKARSGGEYTGGGGSGTAGFITDDQNRLREQFVINLERFAAGRLPKATAADRQQAEQQLQAADQAVKGIPVDPGAPTLEGLKAAQDAWQSLFEAWMKFVPIAYPDLSPDVAATELLRLRIHQLKKVVN